MTLTLSNIRDNAGARTVRKRVGRGLGSGLGKTCGAGQKGQKSRTGVAIRAFEGGQMPIFRRLPKRGFVRPFVELKAELTFRALQAAINRGTLDAKNEITLDVLKACGLVHPKAVSVKLLASGELTSVVKLVVTNASSAAKARVESLGGGVTLAS